MIDTIDESTRPGPGRLRRVLLPVAKGAVSVALLVWLLRRSDTARLGDAVRHASVTWLVAALGMYLLVMLVSTWRWRVLLSAQAIAMPPGRLFKSYLVATFFNNFLPSNIGGDVIRIRDTADAAGSRTLATTVILIDRGVGLVGLLLVAAIGASEAHIPPGRGVPISAGWLWLGFGLITGIFAPVLASPNGVQRLLGPLRRLRSNWVETRVERVTQAVKRLREHPAALGVCFVGAVTVQAVLVGFYVCVARGLAIPIAPAQLATIVPLSFVVQMLPISMNGFGVREATFSMYFVRLGLSLESALLLSITGAGLVMLFSLSGAGVYLSRALRPRPI
jgi:glycosyltransferase 2 family protein